MKLSKEKKRELNKLVDESSSTPAEMEKARKAINTIVKEIKRAMASMEGVSVDRVFKGGSWKKGTILREVCDVDVVVFINCVDYQDFTSSVKNVLIHIGDHIMELPSVHMLRESPYEVTFRYKMAHVSVMVAYNKAINSTENSVKDQRDACLKMIQEDVTLDSTTALSLSASFSETACSLLQWRNVESDHVLSRGIKLLKYWNKCSFEQDVSHRTQLPGYALEILMAHIYDKHKARDVNAPLMFCYALDILANLDTTPVEIALPDFVTIPASPTTRPLRIYEPCLATDIIEEFESWRSLICVAKKTLELIKEDAALEKVFFLPKSVKVRRSPGHSPDVHTNGEHNHKHALERVASDIKIQASAIAKSTDNMERMKESLNVTATQNDGALVQINTNVEKIRDKMAILSSTLAEQKLISKTFYYSLLDTANFPKIEFTCQRHGGVTAQVQVMGDLVIVEGGTDHSTCDLWATPSGLDNWKHSPAGAKPLFPIKLDFKVGGGEKEGEEGKGERVSVSVQEEGIRVQKSNPAKCGSWVAFYSKTKPGLAGQF